MKNNNQGMVSPVKFKGCNHDYAKNQDEYNTLYGYKTIEGDFTICYKIGFWTVLKLLFTCKLWLTVLTFNRPLQPLRMSCIKPKEI